MRRTLIHIRPNDSYLDIAFECVVLCLFTVVGLVITVSLATAIVVLLVTLAGSVV